jgi:hypothetical protein
MSRHVLGRFIERFKNLLDRLERRKISGDCERCLDLLGFRVADGPEVIFKNSHPILQAAGNVEFCPPKELAG